MSADSLNHLAHVGTVVDVLWTEEELDGTNWKPGWYRGEVQRYDEDEDLLYILYFKFVFKSDLFCKGTNEFVWIAFPTVLMT